MTSIHSRLAKIMLPLAIAASLSAAPDGFVAFGWLRSDCMRAAAVFLLAASPQRGVIA